MKKNLILTTAALALSLFWVGCHKSGKLANPSGFTKTDGPVELKLKWPQGERIVQDMDMKQSMEFTIPGQPAPMQQVGTMGQEYGLKVLQETPGGGHEVEMDFLSAQVGSRMGTKVLVDYDSGKKPAAGKADPTAELFGKIIGSKIRFFLNASNEVDRIEGLDELNSRLSAGAAPEQLAFLKDMYSEGSLKQMMSQYRFLPTKPVQPGDSWPVQFEIPRDRIGTLLVDFTFTFQNWELHGARTCARMEFQGTIKSKPGAEATPASGMSISNLEGTTSGITWFDPELGITIDTSITQDLGMVINVPSKQAPGGMLSLTNQMNQVITIKLASVK